MDERRLISSVSSHVLNPKDNGGDNIYNETIFDLSSTQRRISGMKLTDTRTLQRTELDSGTTDVPTPSTFQSNERHSDVSAEQLSERWGISLKSTQATLKKTTQRFLRSAVLPLSRRYRTDRMFERKTLKG